jgi:hypothetical protein
MMIPIIDANLSFMFFGRLINGKATTPFRRIPSPESGSVLFWPKSFFGFSSLALF